MAGVAICLAAGTFLSLLFGPEQIDFQQSEIMANIRPTLLDLAIGFSAGLAAAYAAVNPRIGHSVAGVAIAISLVPPLCVAGLCLGGGLAGQGTFREAGGGFLLFFANFVAIELAAGIVFALAGLSRWGALRRDKQLWRAFMANLLLLGLTAWFLQRQLSLMLQERRIDKAVRAVVMNEFGKISGTRLDSLRLRFVGESVKVELLARAPEELSVSFAEHLREQLTRELKRPIELSIGTSLSSYVTPSGRLFVPAPGAPKPEEVLRANTEAALQEALSTFSHVDLVNFRELDTQNSERRLFVAIRSPYVFNEELVSRLQRQTQQLLESKTGTPQPLSLVVRTSLTQDYTTEGRLSVPLESFVTEAERRRTELEQHASAILAREISNQPGAALLETRASLVPVGNGEGEHLDVEIKVQTTSLLSEATVMSWRQQLQVELGRPTRLECSNVLGQRLNLPAELPTPVPDISATPDVVPSPSATASPQLPSNGLPTP